VLEQRLLLPSSRVVRVATGGAIENDAGDVFQRNRRGIVADEVAVLGAARAAMFLAMVPAVAVLFGIPVPSERPKSMQWLGLAVVLAGPPLAMGLAAARC
jgi:hypothetical protein